MYEVVVMNTTPPPSSDTASSVGYSTAGLLGAEAFVNSYQVFHGEVLGAVPDQSTLVTGANAELCDNRSVRSFCFGGELSSACDMTLYLIGLILN